MVLTKGLKTMTQSGILKEGKTGKRDGAMDRLQVQFTYFWKETLAALGDAGVAVPLDMLDDRSSRIFNFVENRCPQLLFELMNANPDCRLVTRCAMSLIIVTIAILKKRVIPDPDSRRSLLYPEVESLERIEIGYNDLNMDMSKWADVSLCQISDNAYISILVNMLQDTHEDVSIELTLFVIESMVVYSADAAMCLLKAPYNPKNEARLRLEEEQAEKDIKAGKRGKYSPKPSPSSICNIITTVGAHRNREAMAGSLANIITAIIKFTPAEHQGVVAANIARSTVPLELPLKHHHHMPSSASSSTTARANASTANSPTLRRMKSARTTKGSPENAFEKALKGFSKVSKKMAYDQFGIVLHGLDPLANTRSKKATRGGGRDAQAGTTGGGGGGGGTKSGTGKGGAVASSPVPESTAGLMGATKAKQKDWVGLRMMLRFLGRYSLYVDGALLNKDGYTDPTMTKAQKKFRKTEMSEAEENYVTARNSHQGRQLDDAHGKIIRALCCLIYASDDVAREVRKFRRLDRLLEASVKPHKGNALIMDDLVCARAAIKDVAEMDRLRELQLYHPYSYAQTVSGGGVSGPVSVAGSMGSALSPKSAVRGGSSKSVRDEAKAVLSFADEADKMGSGSNQVKDQDKGTTYAFDRMGSLDTRSTQLSPKDGLSNMSAVLSEKLEPLHTRASTAPVSTGASQSLSLSVDSIVSTASSRPRSPGEKVVRNGRHFAPESPVRRGLDHVNISTDGALHNAFFKVLPTKPLYPERIETEVIVEQSERVVDILSKSIAESRKTERRVMSKVVRDGYYITSGPDTGKSTIPILERARRSYNPSGRAITAGEMYRVKPPVSGSQAYGADTTSSHPKATRDTEPRAPFTVRDAPDTEPMAKKMDEVTNIPMDMPLPVVEAPALIAAAPGAGGSRPNSAPHEIMAEEVVTSSIELSMTSISEQFYQAGSGGVGGGSGAPAPPSPSMNTLDIQEETAGYGADPEGFNLDAEETFADGYADFTPGYAMASPAKPGADADADDVGFGMGMGGEGKGGDMHTDPNTGKAFNEESMSMVMQSLDLLFPE
jgi:hypothetical protein